MCHRYYQRRKTYLILDGEVSIVFHQQGNDLTKSSRYIRFSLLNLSLVVRFKTIRVDLMRIRVIEFFVESVTRCKHWCHAVHVCCIDIDFLFQQLLHHFDIEIEARDQQRCLTVDVLIKC